MAPKPEQAHGEDAARQRQIAATLDGKIRRSRRALLIEQVWPRLWLPVAVAGLFLLAALTGVLPRLGEDAHGIALGVFAVAGLASLVPLFRIDWPSRQDALRRLERLSGIEHRPASSYEDRLSTGAADGPEAGIWAVHRRRLALLVERLTVRPPRPRVEPHDPFALRALLTLGVAIAVLVSGGAFRDRLGEALRLSASTTASTARLDAWVTPPSYTRRQPVLLIDGSRQLGEDTAAARAFEVPEGSQVVVRATGSGHDRFKVMIGEGTSETALPGAAPAGASKGIAEFRTVLKSSTTIRVLDGDSERFNWRIAVLDDAPPTIEHAREPGSTGRGGLVLTYRTTDDYGVAAAEAKVALLEPPRSKPLKLADGSEVGPLGEAPSIALKLPRGKDPKTSEGRSQTDLAAHLWAGLEATLTLEARDQAGQIGSTRPLTLVLPARTFNDPLAKALVEQRRKLALSPGSYGEVIKALDALLIAPELFAPKESVYLGIRTASRRLVHQLDRDGIESVVEQLWAIALSIEDGNLSDAERALRDAQDRLARALKDGAPQEEIERLMAELRQALAQYLRELAEQARRNPDANAGRDQQNRTMSARDLEQMLKNIEDMAKSGARDQAQQMLSELRDLLDRLQAGQQAGDGQSQQMMQMLEQFGNLIGEQRKLLDDTFGAQRGGRLPRPGKGGQSGEQGEPGEGGDGEQGQAGPLGRRQGDLAQQLERLMEELRGLGQGSEEALANARRAMREAEGALGQDDLDAATRQQSEALDQLRRGARQMTEQMLGGRAGATGSRAGGNDDRDPLNRPMGELDPYAPGDSTKIPRDIDVQRAREILDELRRRLGENTRPPKELDYLERLLKQN